MPMAQTTDSQQDAAREARKQVKKATRFWTKLSEDWVLNFSGMLAYNYLTAIAPILLALLAIGGIVLGSLSPAAYDTFTQGLAAHLPPGMGESLVSGALSTLRKEAGILLIIAIIIAIYSGSRLFVALENVFSVIFRVDVRPFIRQNIVALLMMLLFLVLAPLAFFAASLPATVLSLFLPAGVQSNGVIVTLEGLGGGLATGFVLFAAMYFVVPNRKQTWGSIWRGALVAAVLMNLYEALFPIYQSLFLKNAGYGSVAGLAIVILIFLYYIGFITLLGAEINAWAAGLRPLGATLPELFRQQRREGVGNAPGAPRTGISRTPPPTASGGSAGRTAGATSPDDSRQSAAPRPAHPLAATRSDTRRDLPQRQRGERARGTPATSSAGRITRPFAAVATVGAMLGAGATLAWRRITQQTQPTSL